MDRTRAHQDGFRPSCSSPISPRTVPRGDGLAAQALRDTALCAIHARLRPVHRGWPSKGARNAEPLLPRGIPAHRVPPRLSLLARRAVLMWEVFVEFLVLFIAAGCGFIVGVGFMAIVLAAMLHHRDRKINRLTIEIHGLHKELADAIGNNDRQDEHPDVGRPPPTSPMGDVPGAGSSPLGDASVGRKG